MIQLNVEIEQHVTTVRFGERGVMNIYRDLKELPKPEETEPLLYFKGREPQAIDYSPTIDSASLKKADSLVKISVPWEVEGRNLAQQMLDVWQENALKTAGLFEPQKISSNHFPTVSEQQKELFAILAAFGYENQKIKAKPAKAQHRWNKKVSEVSFYVDYKDSMAEVIWQKRNEMLVKAGAKMTREIPLKKDGSIGFDGRFGEKLRADHAKQFSEFTTTEDIIFKSVNETGLFLYFGGTNGWLVMKDKDGKTIDEYTVVN